MPKKSNYPEGKKKTIKVDINIDFEKEMKSAITKVRKKYWIDNKNKETEAENLLYHLLSGVRQFKNK